MKNLPLALMPAFALTLGVQVAGETPGALRLAELAAVTVGLLSAVGFGMPGQPPLKTKTISTEPRWRARGAKHD